jgi:tetratricopeptide (TPR) repeat protein
VVGHYPTARECFREARASNALNTPELLDVMIGNTFINEGLLTEEPSLYAESEDSYKMAIKANGEYSRAHVGLAGVLYERARTSAGANGYKDVDTKLLDDSIGEYEKALSPDTKRPLFADIESKVHFGLGQAYFLKALVIADRGDEEQASALLEQSRQAYQSVINEYLGADADSQERLKERTAHAHARLGLMHRFVNQTDKARAEYVLALDMVPKLGRTIIDRARYNVALGEIDLKEGKLEDAKVRHENAAKLIPTPNAPKVLAEKQKYLDTAAKIQAQIDVLSSPTPKD